MHSKIKILAEKKPQNANFHTSFEEPQIVQKKDRRNEQSQLSSVMNSIWVYNQIKLLEEGGDTMSLLLLWDSYILQMSVFFIKSYNLHPTHSFITQQAVFSNVCITNLKIHEKLPTKNNRKIE